MRLYRIQIFIDKMKQFQAYLQEILFKTGIVWKSDLNSDPDSAIRRKPKGNIQGCYGIFMKMC